MNTKVLNDRLVFAWPEGFEEMSAEDISKNSTPWGAPEFMIKDTERHIIVSAGYKRINGFSAMMLSEKDAADQIKSELTKAMRNMDVHFDEAVNEKIGDQDSAGWRYGYTVQGIDMGAESIVFKDGKDLYYLHFYYRQALKAESLNVIAEMLKESSWK